MSAWLPPVTSVMDQEPSWVLLVDTEFLAVRWAQPIERLQESCLTRLVLSDQAGDIALDLDRRGIEDVSELLYLELLELHAVPCLASFWCKKSLVSQSGVTTHHTDAEARHHDSGPLRPS